MCAWVLYMNFEPHIKAAWENCKGMYGIIMTNLITSELHSEAVTLVEICMDFQ